MSYLVHPRVCSIQFDLLAGRLVFLHHSHHRKHQLSNVRWIPITIIDTP